MDEWRFTLDGARRLFSRLFDVREGEAMASVEPTSVVAAMDILEQRNRVRLIPALILHHGAEPVLLRALEIFGASSRRDWIPLGERLLSNDSEAVRVAAVRALARHGVKAAIEKATADSSTTVHAYASYCLAIASHEEDLAVYPALAAIVDAQGAGSDPGRQTLLKAIADSNDSRAVSLVLAIVGRMEKLSRDSVTAIASAMGALADERLLPFLIARLGIREARDAIRRTLVSMGDRALEALGAAFDDPSTDPLVRVALDRERTADSSPCEQLLVGLLRDKESQALERAFRLLKIAHKREDIHRVHTAATSSDRKSRSNAGEFIDSLLSARRQSDMRELFRIVVDDLEPDDRVTRAMGHLDSVPRTRDDALRALAKDRDEGLSALAGYDAMRRFLATATREESAH